MHTRLNVEDINIYSDALRRIIFCNYNDRKVQKTMNNLATRVTSFFRQECFSAGLSFQSIDMASLSLPACVLLLFMQLLLVWKNQASLGSAVYTSSVSFEDFPKFPIRNLHNYLTAVCAPPEIPSPHEVITNASSKRSPVDISICCGHTRLPHCGGLALLSRHHGLKMKEPMFSVESPSPTHSPLLLVRESTYSTDRLGSFSCAPPSLTRLLYAPLSSTDRLSSLLSKKSFSRLSHRKSLLFPPSKENQCFFQNVTVNCSRSRAASKLGISAKSVFSPSFPRHNFDGKNLEFQRKSLKLCSKNSEAEGITGVSGCLKDFESFRKDFPFFSSVWKEDKNERNAEGARGEGEVYFDSAATSQKPWAVLKAMEDYYTKYCANVHRATHKMALKATEELEESREILRNFINAEFSEEVVFTSGATDAFNLVANTWGEANISPGDRIIVSPAEHHSNLVPWQMLAKRKNASLHFAKLKMDGSIDIDHLERLLLTLKPKLVAIHHISNVLGVINPIKEVAKLTHTHGSLLLVDACQSIPHILVNVRDLGCDFLVASGHKMCGPCGVGFLYGKHHLLEAMPPWKGGGEMIEEVYLESSTYAKPPFRFEAGTPPIADIIGLGAAAKYLSTIGMKQIDEQDSRLGAYLLKGLSSIPDLQIFASSTPSRILPPSNFTSSLVSPSSKMYARIPLVCFNHSSLHPHDISTFLDFEGIAVRSGHLCSQILHRDVLSASGTVRASLHFYNTREEIERFISALQKVIAMLQKLKED